jgi:hypothetical protein
VTQPTIALIFITDLSFVNCCFVYRMGADRGAALSVVDLSNMNVPS